MPEGPVVEPVPMVAVQREYEALRSKLEAAALRVLASGSYVLGAEGGALEEEIARFLGVRHAVGCANGTDALILALRAIGVKEGDDVIVPAFTFAATAEAVVLVGARPIFADIDLDTFLIDMDDVQRRITASTRAVVPVHLFGRCVDWKPLQALAAAHDVALVEDAAQAIGADDGNGRAGALGHVAAFSFYPTKNLGAAGDGGLVTTNDDATAKRLRLLRHHGSAQTYLHQIVGMNSRLDELQAALLRVKLPHLQGWNERRQSIAARYRLAARASGLALPMEPARGHHVFHHFTVRTRDRDRFTAHLRRHAIAHGIYYPVPLHRQPAFSAAATALPNAERAAAEVLSLPVHPWLRDEECARVEVALGEWRETGRPLHEATGSATA